MTAPGERGAARLQAGARTAGLFAAMVGTLVLLGWLLQIRALMQVFPGLVAMAPNAAVGFLLLGLSLWLQTGTTAESRLRGSRVAAVAAGLLGLLTFGEYVSGTNLGIDEILFRDTAGLSRPFPGRMAGAVALCFVTLGPALVLTSLRRAPWLAQSLGMIVGLVVLLGLTGYAYGVQGLVSIDLYKGMALHAALALFVLALGVLLVSGGSFLGLIVSDTAGGVVARWFLPIGLVLPLLLGWLRLVGQQAGLYGTDFGQALQALSTSVMMAAILWPMALRLMRADEHRKRNEQALRESEERYRHIVETTGEGIWIYDEQLTTIFVNRRMAEMLGYSTAEMIGRPALGFFAPDSKEAAEAKVEKRRAGIGERVEYRFSKKDGSILWASVAVTPQTDASARFAGSVALVTDITERKRAERELSERADDLARSNQELEQFAYVASHDLQEPLRMVSSFTQLLGRRYEGKLDADADEFIAYAVEGATRMQTMINDLLAYSRLGNKGWPVGPVDCQSVLARVLANLGPTVEEGHAVVTSDPLPTVSAHETQVTQLLQNLVSNAIKFRGEGLPVVHVSATRAGAEWVFSVRDNGIGIAPEHRDRIFVIFQRLNPRDRYSGTGIGLAICKKIVDRHRGRIWVESEPGRGSTFFFTIPEKEEVNP